MLIEISGDARAKPNIREIAEVRRSFCKFLAELAHGWGLTLTQLAIAYMLQIPGMGPVIPACFNPRQVAENTGAGKINLEKERMAAVERISKVPIR